MPPHHISQCRVFQHNNLCRPKLDRLNEVISLAFGHLEDVYWVEEDFALVRQEGHPRNVGKPPIHFSSQIVEIDLHFDPGVFEESCGLLRFPGGGGEAFHLYEPPHIILQDLKLTWIHSAASEAGEIFFPEIVMFLTNVAFEDGEEEILNWQSEVETVQGRTKPSHGLVNDVVEIGGAGVLVNYILTC